MVFYLVLFVIAQILPGMAFMSGHLDLAIIFEVPILSLFMYINILGLLQTLPRLWQEKANYYRWLQWYSVCNR